MFLVCSPYRWDKLAFILWPRPFDLFYFVATLNSIFFPKASFSFINTWMFQVIKFNESWTLFSSLFSFSLHFSDVRWRKIAAMRWRWFSLETSQKYSSPLCCYCKCNLLFFTTIFLQIPIAFYFFFVKSDFPTWKQTKPKKYD